MHFGNRGEHPTHTPIKNAGAPPSPIRAHIESVLHTLIQTNRHDRQGNFQYAAPEQRSNGDVSHLADIYSLGLILNEMITGQLLIGIGHTPIAAIRHGYSYLDPIVNRMSQQLPENRPQTVAEIRAMLSEPRNASE